MDLDLPGLAWITLDFRWLTTRIQSDPVGLGAIGCGCLIPPVLRVLRGHAGRSSGAKVGPREHFHFASRIQSDPLGLTRIRSDRTGFAQPANPRPLATTPKEDGGLAVSANPFTTICQRSCIPGGTGCCKNPSWLWRTRAAEFIPQKGLSTETPDIISRKLPSPFFRSVSALACRAEALAKAGATTPPWPSDLSPVPI